MGLTAKISRDQARKPESGEAEIKHLQGFQFLDDRSGSAKNDDSRVRQKARKGITMPRYVVSALRR
jgi:hypothetical protein